MRHILSSLHPTRRLVKPKHETWNAKHPRLSLVRRAEQPHHDGDNATIREAREKRLAEVSAFRGFKSALHAGICSVGTRECGRQLHGVPRSQKELAREARDRQQRQRLDELPVLGSALYTGEAECVSLACANLAFSS